MVQPNGAALTLDLLTSSHTALVYQISWFLSKNTIKWDKHQTHFNRKKKNLGYGVAPRMCMWGTGCDLKVLSMDMIKTGTDGVGGNHQSKTLSVSYFVWERP